MARLVTSDGVQVNLFLDLDSNNTGEGTLLYGPKSQPNMDFIVQGFKDFRTNTEFNNKNRLVFHCDHQITVYISSITGVNYPTSSNPYSAAPDTKLYYVGNDLVLSKTGTKIHRIDLFKSASTNIDDLEDSMFDGDYNSLVNKPSLFDGNYNSLTNKPTIPSDVNDLSDADGLLSSGGGSGGSGRNVVTFLASTQNWVKPAGVEYLEIVLVGGGQGGKYGDASQDNLGGNSIITFSSGDSVTALGGGQVGNTSGGKDGFGSGLFTGPVDGITYDYAVQSLKEFSTGLRTIYGDRNSSGWNGVTYGSNPRSAAGLAIHKPSEYTFTDRWNNFLEPTIEVPYYQAGPYNGTTDADIRGTGGGANGTTSLGGGDGGGGDVATLGGDGSTYFGTGIGRGGDGNLGGGGGGYNINYSPSTGGSGAGAGGGHGPQSFGFSTVPDLGSVSGETKIFTKIVPAAAATYTIVIGAGGNGYYLGGGGGQGICIIRY